MSAVVAGVAISNPLFRSDTGNLELDVVEAGLGSWPWLVWLSLFNLDGGCAARGTSEAFEAAVAAILSSSSSAASRAFRFRDAGGVVTANSTCCVGEKEGLETDVETALFSQQHTVYQQTSTINIR